MMGSISAAAVQPVIRALNDLGYDGDRVLASAGLGKDLLVDPHARIPSGMEAALWDAAVDITGDPMISLRVAECTAVGAAGAFEYLLRNSANVRAALDHAERFMRVIDDQTHVSVFEDGDEARIRMWRDGGSPMPSRGGMHVSDDRSHRERARSCRGLSRACFRHKPHGDPETYARYFRCNVRFDAAHDELTIARDVLDAPSVRADAGLAVVLEDHLQRLLQALPDEDPLAHRARGGLLTALDNGGASFDALAATLAMSPRTLRRKLTERGVAYKTLLDEVRRDIALYYVARIGAPRCRTGQLWFYQPSTFIVVQGLDGTTPAPVPRPQTPERMTRTTELARGTDGELGDGSSMSSATPRAKLAAH